MDIVLPKEIAYSPSLPALPEATSIEVVNSPINGNSFTPGSLVQIDLVNRGFLDPTSIYLRYKLKLTAAVNATIPGTPGYTVLNKLESLIGSTVYESITNYNHVMNVWTNLQMDVAMKYGQQSAYGWTTASGSPSIEELDGRTCAVNEDISFAVPISCLFSNAEKMIPMFCLPGCRLQFTLASLAEAFGATVAVTDYSVYNVELCYTIVDFAGGVNDLVKNMSEKFYIKTSSFQNAMTPLTGSGTVDLIYNMRLASIKSLFATFYNNSDNRATCINGIFDSVEPGESTAGTDLQFNIAGTYLPTRAVSTKNNRSGVLMELKRALGALHSENFNFSINSKEFGYNSASTTTLTAPGKFIFGVNCEKLSTNGALLTGISTQNSPITLRIGRTATTSMNVQCFALYDALIEVDPHNRQATVKQ